MLFVLAALGLVLAIDDRVRKLAMLLNAFRQRDADALLVFIDWVPTPANVADRPTRN